MSGKALDLTKSFLETLTQIKAVKVPGTNRESQSQFSAEISRLEQTLELKCIPLFE